MVLMSTLTYDQLFQTVLGLCASFILFSSLWIVYILIQIEQNKAAFYSIDVDDDTKIQSSLDLEVEHEDGKPNSPKQQDSQVVRKQRQRRIRPTFTLIQFASVGCLVLLTYLLLVTSNAPMWLSAIGSLCVFGVFLRFQIGDEIRRQRWDRLTLLLSLFLLIASLLSLGVYSMKSLKRGEIYEGPARIVAYDAGQYNNTDHDPSRRTDLYVQWGSDWGCPLSGSQVCQAQVQGAMCQVNTGSTTDGGNNRKRRVLADGAAAAGSGNNATVAQEEEENATLEQENSELEQENAELEQKIEELEQANAEEEEVAETEVEAAQEQEAADTAEADAEIVQEEVYEYEDAEYEDQAIYDAEEDVLEVEAENTSNSADAAEYEQEEEEYEEVSEEVEEEYDEIIDELSEDVEEYEESEEEHEEAAEELEDTAEDLQIEEEETVEEAEEGGSEAETEAAAEEEEAIEEEVEEEEVVEEEQEEEEEYEEAEIEEEEYENYYDADDWYWDEITFEYDDDYYESEYWDYDWDSVWGEYACEDLFDEDRSGKTYDGSTPAGGDDEWPYINIYGSCKTCDAYILDYFAEQAFERVDDYKKQAFLYMSASTAGFLISLVGFIKYKIAPPAENEIQLLESDGGVIA